jgi:hypothetical protein
MVFTLRHGVHNYTGFATQEVTREQTVEVSTVKGMSSTTNRSEHLRVFTHTAMGKATIKIKGDLTISPGIQEIAISGWGATGLNVVRKVADSEKLDTEAELSIEIENYPYASAA